jgi:hypothetical protein
LLTAIKIKEQNASLWAARKAAYVDNVSPYLALTERALPQAAPPEEEQIRCLRVARWISGDWCWRDTRCLISINEERFCE